MKRIVTLLLTGIMVLASLVGFAGCTPPVPNDAQTLEIYIGNFGYGYAWLEDVIEKFKEQDWVNEKYPNLNIPAIKQNSESGYAAERIVAGPNANTIDLLFTTNPACASFNSKDSNGKYYFAELEDVYDSEVPGEGGIKVKEKMKPDFYEHQRVEVYGETNEDGSPRTTYYGMPWVDGYMGILYNKTLIETAQGLNKGENYIMPRTTEEFKTLIAEIKTAKISVTTGNRTYTAKPLISAANVGYWNQMFNTWWAQYEGLDGYERYWTGTNALGDITRENIAQKGRLRALEVLESLICYTAGNNHDMTNTMSFTQAQSKFLIGEGIFMPNGDWFENEMSTTAAENPHDYEIIYMKMPVISSITEKCTTVKDDKALAFVVQAVDDGKDYDTTKAEYNSAKSGFATASQVELAQADYNRIKEARGVMYRIEGHEAYIPEYATAKELAKDFLRFLATDEAIHTFMEVTNGCSTAYQYDLATKDAELYASMPEIHKSRLEYSKTGTRLPAWNAFRLAYYGGLNNFSQSGSVETWFTAQNEDDRMTAKEIYDKDIDYFDTQDGYYWDSMLIKAGMKS